MLRKRSDPRPPSSRPASARPTAPSRPEARADPGQAARLGIRCVVVGRPITDPTRWPGAGHPDPDEERPPLGGGPEQPQDLFKKSGALEDFCLLRPALDQYFQCALLLSDVMAERMGRESPRRCRGVAPTAVVGPALSGVIIGHEVARAGPARSYRARTGRWAGAVLGLAWERVVGTRHHHRQVHARGHRAPQGPGAEPVGALSIGARRRAAGLGVPTEHLARLPAWGTRCALCAPASGRQARKP